MMQTEVSMKAGCLCILAVLLATPAADATEFHGVVQTYDHEVAIDSLVVGFDGGGSDTLLTPGWGGPAATTDTFDFPDQPSWPISALLCLRVDGGLPRTQPIGYPMRELWYPLLDSAGRVKFYSQAGVAGRPATELPGAALEVCPSVVGPRTLLGFRLNGTGHATLTVFDADGNTVCRFEVPARTRSLSWDGTDASGRRLAEGIYFCRLAVGRASTTRKVLLVR